MPLTAKGSEIKANMERQYGAEKGEKVFYASKNAGTISGVDSARRMDASVKAMCDAFPIGKDKSWGVITPAERNQPMMKKLYESSKPRPTKIDPEKLKQAQANRQNTLKLMGFGDSAKRMNDSVAAMCDACGVGDDRRVVGGVGARFDASKKGEHELTVEFDGDFDMGGLMRALQYLGAIGASRTLDIAVDDRDIQGDLKKEGIPSKLGWDGDGADKIRSCTIDGKSVLK